ncbi:MAG: hypothetical protein J5722_07045 [Oscillospiraceae bacterium]|nr:hypothetical protein [Oscillospiraceae bacterium]
MEMTRKAELREDQYQRIIEFLDEQRSKFMHKLYISIGGSVLLAVPGMVTLSNIQYSKAVGMDGHAGNRSSDAAFYLWVICVIVTIVLLLTGFQNKFGARALINRFKRREFTCEFVTVGQLSGGEGRPPYLMKDSLGTDYYVPVFLDYKQLKPGGPAIGIYMTSGGERFAVHDPSQDF